MYVVKRGNRGYEPVQFDKITKRIQGLCNDLESVNALLIAKETIQKLYNMMQTRELDYISANIAESYKLVHPNYSKLAARLLISNLHKSTPNSFSECMKNIQSKLNIFNNRAIEFINTNAKQINKMIEYKRDYELEYFGFKVLEKSYLYKHKDTIIDRPQYMYMRVAISLYLNTTFSTNDSALKNIKKTYDLLSLKYYTHATPTLFNACTKHEQMSSCFLLGTNDSIEGIMKTISDVSFISKRAGGIGIHMHNIRPKGSLIKSTNGKSSGLIPQLKIYNECSRTWNQGGKRNGAFAIYLEPWHADILDFLELKLQNGAETERARDLFYSLWIPDLFMERVNNNKMWSLFSENEALGLSDVYDGMLICTECNYCDNINYKRFQIKFKDFLKQHKLQSSLLTKNKCNKCSFVEKNMFSLLYEFYEKVLNPKQILARDIINKIITTQRESGTPYTVFKDHVNRMSNQSNIGTIKSSNLCSEIVEWSDDKSYATCTLASINLQQYITKKKKITFDFDKLISVVKHIVCCLDIIVDNNNYPVKECESNAYDYRPIGIGVQGLADVFARFRIPFDSKEAAKLDKKIFETIYYTALTQSCELAKNKSPYTKFDGSPLSKGQFHFDLWLKNQKQLNYPCEIKTLDNLLCGDYNWNELRANIKQFGVRNSLLVALMPTVSTSQIMGNNESFEPFSTNIYTKTTLSGKFTICNSHMINHLNELNKWNTKIKDNIIQNEGSLKGTDLPKEIRDIYKTTWEIKQLELMKRASIRNAFVDQSQSLNIHIKNNSSAVLRAIMINAWKLGLKTGSYYIRTRTASKALKTTITYSNESEQVYSFKKIKFNDSNECTMCSS